MNYYPHNMGDYAKDASHLTMLEDGAYRRMIDVYYSTERPLPLDRAALYRLVRAQGKERVAVDSVLQEFFRQCADGWHHKRCDEEIARAQEKSLKAASSAAQRWHSDGNANAQRKHSEGNAPNNQEPITNTYTTDFETAWEIYPNRLGDNPKRKAFRAWSARLSEGHGVDEMRSGVERYAAFCKTTGKLGTESVKHAATFFGPDKPFLLAWGAAPKEKKVAL